MVAVARSKCIVFLFVYPDVSDCFCGKAGARNSVQFAENCLIKRYGNCFSGKAIPRDFVANEKTILLLALLILWVPKCICERRIIIMVVLEI